MRAVPLHGAKARGRVAWVSERDYDRVMAYRWYVWERWRPNGSRAGPYAVANVRLADGRWTTIRMHQLIMGCRGIDHRNGYGLDCTRRNLREATGAENARNRASAAGASSDYLGVSWDRRARKWQAFIKVDRRNQYLGYFAVAADAARAYNTKALELHGAFARLNEIADPKDSPEIPSDQGTLQSVARL